MRTESLSLTFVLALALVGCGGPGTLTVGGEGEEGMVDTDGDGIPDAPDSDGDGIPDEDDDNPDIPDDDDEPEDFEYLGEYDGTIAIVIDWGNGIGEYDYCDDSEAVLSVSNEQALTGEGSCYSEYFEADIELEYSGGVDEDGKIEGEVSMLVWVPEGGGGGSWGGGGWTQESYVFDFTGSVEDKEFSLDWDGEIEFGRDDLSFWGWTGNK